MIGRSMQKPKSFWLRRKELDGEKLTIWLRIRQNIKTVEVEEMDGETHNEYEFDEEEIKLNLDADLFDETADMNTQIKDYLKAHKTELKNRIKKLIFLRQNVKTIIEETD